MSDNFLPDVLHRPFAVSWGGGFYVLVEARAFYEHAALGTRSATLDITTAGVAAGGKIIAQNLWHVEELADSSPEAHPAYTLYRAVLQFSRGTKDLASGYFLTLTGSLNYVDPIQGPPINQLFCATSTNVTVYGPLEAEPNPFAPGVNQFFRNITSTYSTPAGTEVTTYRAGPLADLTNADIGTGGHTVSTSSTTAWYRDEFGNFINTNRPCSEIPPTGGAPPPATRIEGWNNITGLIYGKAGVTVLPVASWLPEMTSDQIMVAKPGTLTPSQPAWIMTVPQSVVGLNSDFGPIFDDLPSDRYDFVPQAFQFESLPRVEPTVLYKTFGVYSLSPPRAKYHLIVVTRLPPPLRGWAPPQEPVLSGSTVNDEKFFPAGQPPLVGQTFVELT